MIPAPKPLDWADRFDVTKKKIVMVKRVFLNIAAPSRKKITIRLINQGQYKKNGRNMKIPEKR